MPSQLIILILIIIILSLVSSLFLSLSLLTTRSPTCDAEISIENTSGHNIMISKKTEVEGEGEEGGGKGEEGLKRTSVYTFMQSSKVVL